MKNTIEIPQFSKAMLSVSPALKHQLFYLDVQFIVFVNKVTMTKNNKMRQKKNLRNNISTATLMFVGKPATVILSV